MNYDYLKSKKILLVDDEKEILQLLICILKEEGYSSIITSSSAKEAINKSKEDRPDICILDVSLPDEDGFFVMKKLREFSNMPVLFLTAKGENEDKFLGLSLGADDYIVKPFLPRELTLRLNAVLKRTYKNESPLLNLSCSSIDFERAEVLKDNKLIPLTAKEYSILYALYKNANKIVTIDALCEAAWGDNIFGYENSLMAHIRRIREKIELTPSSPVSLITVKGLGYKLIVDDLR